MLAWIVVIRSKKIDNFLSVSWTLVAVSISFLWLNLGRFFPIIFGSSYSNIRFMIMNLNFFAMIVCAAVALNKRNVGRILTFVAAVLLSMAWAVVAVINAVV
jgi:hypothetical protein